MKGFKKITVFYQIRRPIINKEINFNGIAWIYSQICLIIYKAPVMHRILPGFINQHGHIVTLARSYKHGNSKCVMVACFIVNHSLYFVSQKSKK